MNPFFIVLLVEHMAVSGRVLAVNNKGVIESLDYLTRLCFENVRNRLAEPLASGQTTDPLTQHVSRVFASLPVACGTGHPRVLAPAPPLA